MTSTSKIFILSLEWFLLIMCKQHTLTRSTNLFSRNPLFFVLIKKRRLADAHHWTVTLSNWKKQPPEVFYKKSCSEKFCNNFRKTLVLKSFLGWVWNKVAGHQAVRPAVLLKRDSNTEVFLWMSQHFKQQLFWRTSAYSCFWR